jgi:hypothetical protein
MTDKFRLRFQDPLRFQDHITIFFEILLNHHFFEFSSDFQFSLFLPNEKTMDAPYNAGEGCTSEWQRQLKQRKIAF